MRDETRNTHAVYVGNDDWGRPTFKSHSRHYCSVDTLYPDFVELQELIFRLNEEQEPLYIKSYGKEGEPSDQVEGITVYI